MPHSRNTADPTFGDWVTETLLLPTAAGGWPSGMTIVRERPTIIPNYQRGISWGAAQVGDLVYSSSPVIGTVVVGRFNGPPSPYLDAQSIGSTAEYEELADGLQRLSTGVCLLRGLHMKVLAEGAPLNSAKSLFSQIDARYAGLMHVVLHNDHQFRNHPRRAIRDQYVVYAAAVDSWLDKQMEPATRASFATHLTQLMLIRPIALDRWSGFNTGLELMHTFLGLNTVRVELGPVDLLRAHLVVQASKCGWSDSDIEAFENDFTEVFTTRGASDSDLLPFANAILKCISGDGAAPSAVFPSWANLDKNTDVDRFLEFALAFKNGSNEYLDQIRLIGAIPFGIVMAAHLARFRSTNVLPTFLTGSATTSDEAELHTILCASLRSVFARKVGYLSSFIVDILKGVTVSLLDASNRMSQDACGRDVKDLLPVGWLQTTLEGVDKRAARTVFNAMLLPVRSAGANPAGGTFAPIKFGRGASNWAIDHILPEAMLDDTKPGYGEGRRLRNLAPLPGAQNSSAKHASPSVKLQTGVATYYGHALSSHPYCAWLANVAVSQTAGVLDQQAELPANSPSKLGDDRIAFLAAELAQRV